MTYRCLTHGGARAWRRVELRIILNSDCCWEGEEMSPQACQLHYLCYFFYQLSLSLFRYHISHDYFQKIFRQDFWCVCFKNLCLLDLRQRNFSISVEHSPLCHWCTELIPFCWVEKCVYKEPWHFNQPNYLSLTSCSPPRAFIYLSEIVRPVWELLFLLIQRV